ncbi:hypothetical protein C8R46DRAFT_1027600 [Mycena filopes]|nr:hypothetical protein C8R46DRAFT_1027600 [Mycena filopes]
MISILPPNESLPATFIQAYEDNWAAVPRSPVPAQYPSIQYPAHLSTGHRGPESVPSNAVTIADPSANNSADRVSDSPSSVNADVSAATFGDWFPSAPPPSPASSDASWGSIPTSAMSLFSSDLSSPSRALIPTYDEADAWVALDSVLGDPVLRSLTHLALHSPLHTFTPSADDVYDAGIDGKTREQLFGIRAPEWYQQHPTCHWYHSHLRRDLNREGIGEGEHRQTTWEIWEDNEFMSKHQEFMMFRKQPKFAKFTIMNPVMKFSIVECVAYFILCAANDHNPYLKGSAPDIPSFIDSSYLEELGLHAPGIILFRSYSQQNVINMRFLDQQSAINYLMTMRIVYHHYLLWIANAIRLSTQFGYHSSWRWGSALSLTHTEWTHRVTRNFTYEGYKTVEHLMSNQLTRNEMDFACADLLSSHNIVRLLSISLGERTRLAIWPLGNPIMGNEGDQFVRHHLHELDTDVATLNLIVQRDL